MNLWRETIFVVWFFLPAAVANMVPILAAKWEILRFLDRPIDLGKSYRGIRIFGDHKTFRGFVSGTICAIVIVWLQKLVSDDISAHTIDYSSIGVFPLGFLMGLGALSGDAIKSFFKRRVGIKPGESWVPFDQIDFVIGASVFTYFLFPLALSQYVLAIVVFFLLHIVSTYTGYLLRFKKDPI